MGAVTLSSDEHLSKTLGHPRGQDAAPAPLLPGPRGYVVAEDPEGSVCG